jgi:hypothetical protein
VTGLFHLAMSLRFIHDVARDRISFVGLNNVPLYVPHFGYALIHWWTRAASTPRLLCE